MIKGETELRLKRRNNIYKFIGIIVTIVSILVSVYIFRAKNTQRKLFEAALANKVIELIDARNEIIESREIISSNQRFIEILKDSISGKAILLDSVYREIETRNIFIYNLKQQLDEAPIPIIADDDEHFRIFLEWTRPPR